MQMTSGGFPLYIPGTGIKILSQCNLSCLLMCERAPDFYYALVAAVLYFLTVGVLEKNQLEGIRLDSLLQHCGPV